MEYKSKQTVAITGAAGNLGNILAQSMVCDNVILHLLWHRKEISPLMVGKENVKRLK